MPLTMAPVTALELPVRGRLEMILMVPLVAPPPPPVAPPALPPLPPEPAPPPAASPPLPADVPPPSLCGLHPPDRTTSASAIEIVASFIIASNLVPLADAGQPVAALLSSSRPRGRLVVCTQQGPARPTRPTKS